MTVVLKSIDEETIALPSSLLERLQLTEGDEIKAVIEGQTLRLSRLDDFLALRGILTEDSAFDEAIEELNKAWQSWPLPNSA